MPGKRAGVARWPLAAHLGEGKLLFKTPAVMLKYPLVENTSVDNKGKIWRGATSGGLMLNSDLSPATPHGGQENPTDMT